jgi:archaellum component FlaG (FlaF/FlaG flagellin family)
MMNARAFTKLFNRKLLAIMALAGACACAPVNSKLRSAQQNQNTDSGTILLVAEEGTDYSTRVNTDQARSFHVANTGKKTLTVDSLSASLPTHVTGYFIDSSGNLGLPRTGPAQWSATPFGRLTLQPGENSPSFLLALSGSQEMSETVVQLGVNSSDSANKFSSLDLNFTALSPNSGRGQILLVAEQGTTYNVSTDTSLGLRFHVENTGTENLTFDSLPISLPSHVTGYYTNQNGEESTRRSGPIDWNVTGFAPITLAPGQKSTTFKFVLVSSQVLNGAKIRLGAGASNSANKVSNLSLTLNTSAAFPGQGNIVLVQEQGTLYDTEINKDQALTFHVKNTGSKAMTLDSLPLTLPEDLTAYFIDSKGISSTKRTGPIQWNHTNFTHLTLNPGENSPSFQLVLNAAQLKSGASIQLGAGASDSANKTSSLYLTMNAAKPSSTAGNIVLVPEQGTTYSMPVNAEMALSFHILNTGSQSLIIDSMPITLPTNVTGYFIDPSGNPSTPKTGPVEWKFTQFGQTALQPGQQTGSFKFVLKSSQRLNGASIRFGAGATNSGNQVSSVYATLVNP